MIIIIILHEMLINLFFIMWKVKLYVLGFIFIFDIFCNVYLHLGPNDCLCFRRNVLLFLVLLRMRMGKMVCLVLLVICLVLVRYFWVISSKICSYFSISYFIIIDQYQVILLFSSLNYYLLRTLPSYYYYLYFEILPLIAKHWTTSSDHYHF